jgi:hypothetical protein
MLRLTLRSPISVKSCASTLAGSLLLLASLGGGVVGCSDTGSPAGSGGAAGSGIGGSSGNGGSGGAAGLGGGGGVVGGAGTAGTGGAAGSLGTAGGGSGGGTMGGASGGGAGGASNGGSGGSAIEASFATVKGIIETSCFGAACHSEPGNPLQMKVDDTLYTTLTTHMTKNCGPVIKSGSPQESALVRLLKGPCGKTDRMPFGKCFDDGDPGCIAPDSIAAIEQWIAKGAPK